MPAASVEFSIARISKWLSMSLADKTWHAYITSWNEWMKFKTSFPKVQGEADITKSFLVKQILRGVGRITQAVDIRRPITLSLLKDLVLVLPQCFSQFETILFTWLFSMSFFGALRVSESVSHSKRSPGGIGSEDIHLVEGKLKIILKKSKTDKVGRGTTLWLGNSTEQSICPVSAFSHYQQVRPCLPGPFFIHSDGSFMTRFQFVKILKGAVSKLGIPPEHYNTHSFRIGAATQASLMGLGEDFIKRLGRWNSSRYQLYSYLLFVTVSPPLVWIIGHSFVHRAGDRAEQRTYTTNLDSKDVRIVWMGIRGLKWPDFLPIILQMKARWGFPAIILIHLSGNDIGKGRNIDLIRNIKRDLAQIKCIFPNTVIIWSEVMPGLVWLQDAGFHPLERCRKKLNFAIAKFSKTVNILVYRHCELEQGYEGLYRSDRVLLSDIGFDILNMGFQNAIDRALHVLGMAKANVMI
ncbi:hypothetical protein XELAEV_18046840mg [Xenopus laevis]|uniref:Tyr recombinase domain-containing protein n=1 Tax=Xenopus laevis TaxID=8355 RepID=A0A974BTZ3_XENLA|nr:hypothetical protein XELAEV_18046840mg [Xenopus laevis]